MVEGESFTLTGTETAPARAAPSTTAQPIGSIIPATGHDGYDGHRAAAIGETHHPGEGKGQQIVAVGAAEEHISAARARDSSREFGETQGRGARQQPGQQPYGHCQQRAPGQPGDLARYQEYGGADYPAGDDTGRLDPAKAAQQFRVVGGRLPGICHFDSVTPISLQAAECQLLRCE